MKVPIAYGQGLLPVDFPEDCTTVITPSHAPGLPDEREAFLGALDRPISSPALRELIGPHDRVCILFTDITRATPNHRLIPWLLEYLSHVPRENCVLLNQLGTHRPNTRDELERMLTPGVVRKYRVLNPEPDNVEALVQVGTMRDGTPALINRHCVEADLRIVTGFIEPHFFAGFSGGPKGVIPGVAGTTSIVSNHGARNLENPNSTFGITHGNPLWEELRDVGLRVGRSFLVNVTLNLERQITGVFAGDLLEAHRVGCEFVRRTAMRQCSAPFDLVVTTNSGYPLDLNLYQGVKGMTAAALVVKPGGTIILACECREGVPAQSHFEKLLRSVSDPAGFLRLVATPGFAQPEQWQAHLQALVQTKARVLLHSSLTDEQVRAVHLEPCHDIGSFVRDFVRAHGGRAIIGVLPQGPLTIPYLAGT